ncbi:MAG: hypothetical protein IJG50_00875 [Clostridia bacterium]|nr:hypothetical protein [Clostridia bacterium]
MEKTQGNKVCVVCGRAIDESGMYSGPMEIFNGPKDVPLKDGGAVCRECAEKVRIVCPLKNSRMFLESAAHFGIFESKTGSGHDNRGWINVLIDPIAELDTESFRRVQLKAESAVSALSQRFAGARGAAEADFTYRRYTKDRSKDTPLGANEKRFVTCVKVLFGAIRPGDMVTVAHKDREYTAKVEDVWYWNYLDIPVRPIEKASAGMTAALWFYNDVPFIYPGDTLMVKEGQ